MKVYIHRPLLYWIVWAVVVIIVSWLDLQLPVQSVPITTKCLISNIAHGKVNSIQYYVI